MVAAARAAILSEAGSVCVVPWSRTPWQTLTKDLTPPATTPKLLHQQHPCTFPTPHPTTLHLADMAILRITNPLSTDSISAASIPMTRSETCLIPCPTPPPPLLCSVHLACLVPFVSWRESPFSILALVACVRWDIEAYAGGVCRLSFASLSASAHAHADCRPFYLSASFYLPPRSLALFARANLSLRLLVCACVCLQHPDSRRCAAPLVGGRWLG